MDVFVLNNVKFKHIIDIDELKIPKGKITCIVGKSGSGKSTLLKLLNKIISPDSGKITYNGKDLKNLNSIEFRREVPMLTQFPIIYDGNVRDNLLMGLKFSKKDEKNDQELKNILGKVELNKALEDNPKKMSGGEKQRLSIARIMLMDTDTILLDEPSSSLDENTEYRVIKLMAKEVKEKNKTMIYVTHSKEIAEEFSDNLIRIENGKIYRNED